MVSWPFKEGLGSEEWSWSFQKNTVCLNGKRILDDFGGAVPLSLLRASK